MEYFRFLHQETGFFSNRFLFTAFLASVCDGLIVSSVVTGAAKQASFDDQVSSFVPLLISLLFWFFCRKFILDYASGKVETVVCRLRNRIAEKVSLSELLQLNAAGEAQIEQALAQDCQTLYDTAREIVIPIASVGFLVSCLIYTAILSYTAFICLIVLLSAYVTLQLVTQKSFEREYSRASVEDRHFFERLSDQIKGFKELRINRPKANDLLANDLKGSAERAARIRLTILRKLNAGTVLFQGSYYAILGVLVFVLPGLVQQRNFPVIQLVAVTTFMLGPLFELAMSVPALTRANAAVQRILALEALFPNSEPEPDSATPLAPFQALRCEQLTFRYPPQPERADDTFQVGPLNLEFQRGQIIFLIGGNGSGKSTLLRLLCGLYPASSGRITVNGKKLPLETYRAYFSIILQDFHLFERLLGQPQINHERVRELLKALQLSGITSIDDQGRFTNLKLSTGQKKRLALLVVECDDRELIIFDEWAADQDPEFRHYFYEVYLPELRARGKTILAATHDDHYFHVADRVLRLERGQLSTSDGAALARRAPLPPT